MLDVAIVGDKTKLAQVMRNLLSNALKFTPHGGSVEVAVQRCEMVYGPSMSTMPCISVAIKDSGPGISPSNQSKLFTQIIQFNPGTLQNSRGSGLGLWSESGK